MKFFKDIIEQERAKKELFSSFTHNRLNHAYLFCGDRGIGKLSLAQALAARFLCSDPQDNDACGNCRSCRLLQSGNHPDYIELPREPLELKIRRFTPRSNTGNEDITHPPVLEFMRLKPLNGGGRVCIIPDIERINIEAANAFLKTLEEPPPQSLIILTCSARDRLLATITSRCRIIGMSHLSKEAIISGLQQETEITYADAEQIAELAEGSLGTALELTGTDTLKNWQDICEISEFHSPAEAIQFAGTLTQKLKISKDSVSKRSTALKMLDLLALYIRREMRRGLSPLHGYTALEKLWEAGDTLNANVRPEIVTLNAVTNTVTALHKRI